MINLTEKERKYFEGIQKKLDSVRKHLAKDHPKKTASPSKWYSYLTGFKRAQGNINNWISFVACLMARDYLAARYRIGDFDAAAKAQGAPGLDIDIRTQGKSRIIAEIKATIPYGEDDLGAQQWSSMFADFAKLRRRRADKKFFFVTEARTFGILKRHRDEIRVPGLRIVLLPSGKSFRG